MLAYAHNFSRMNFLAVRMKLHEYTLSTLTCVNMCQTEHFFFCWIFLLAPVIITGFYYYAHVHIA